MTAYFLRILFIRDIQQNPTSYKSPNSVKYFRKKSREEKSKMNPDHLKCPVCMEIFDGKVFILKCGHNLCSICLPKLIQHQVRVTIARSWKIENLSVSNILRYEWFTVTTLVILCEESSHEDYNDSDDDEEDEAMRASGEFSDSD